MYIIFKTKDNLVMGEFKHISVKYEENFLTITFCNENETIEIYIYCKEQNVSKILDKIYKDINQEGICILDDEALKVMDNKDIQEENIKVDNEIINQIDPTGINRVFQNIHKNI